MTLNYTGTGSTWRYGLPPGVYEEKQQANINQNIRMDVAAFIGLAERGPISCPVVVESWDEYISFFGRAGGGRLLAESVRLFFSNGGRRCVVVRVLDYKNAQTTLWNIPQLHTHAAYLPLQLQARNAGIWGNKLQIKLSFQLQAMVARLPNEVVAGQPQILNSKQFILLDRSTRLESGSLLVFKQGKTLLDFRFIREVIDVNSTENEEHTDEVYRLVTLDKEISDKVLLKNCSGKISNYYFQVQHILIDLHISLKQKGAVDKTESWSGLALHPDHPDYFPRIINRKNGAEIYVDDSEWNKNDVELVAIEESLLPEMDSRAMGSELIRYPLHQAYEIFYPNMQHLFNDHEESDLSNKNSISIQGSDAAETTQREHFFTAPKAVWSQAQGQFINAGLFPFAQQSSPLKALSRYDQQNELEPISLLNMPDLAHPKQYVKALEIATETPKITTCFSHCETVSIDRSEQIQRYPKLLMDKQSLKKAQQILIEYCEIKQDRIAILDLPLGLTAGEVISWKRAMQSSRAAFYAPYLEVSQQDINPLIVPPGGAVCGLIASQENHLGIQVAPANLKINTVEKLHHDQFFPDSGFLYQERINSIVEEADGLRLMGSRTTAQDQQWTHLSVRRLLDYLERQLIIDTNWAVFEVNNYALWNRVYSSVNQRLYSIFNKGGFKGATEQESYFVYCNEETNTQSSLDKGQLIILVGVAPSVPTEFIVFKLTQGSEGLASVEEMHG